MKKTSNWIFGNEVMQEAPSGAYGFIYRITYTNPETKEVFLYIGKKKFIQELNMRKGKKELAEMSDKRGSKKKHVIKESNWKGYQGSHHLLSKVDAKDLKKEVLWICLNKTSLTYQEVRFQFDEDVLTDERYLNDNILGKFYKGKV